MIFFKILPCVSKYKRDSSILVNKFPSGSRSEAHTMPSCAVFNCFNESHKQPRDFRVEKPLSFHLFPTNETLRKKWVDFCRRKGPITKIATICSEHFSPDQIRHAGFRYLRHWKMSAAFLILIKSEPMRSHIIWTKDALSVED